MLPADFPDFLGFTQDNIVVTFDANREFPVAIDFDAQVEFEGTDATTPTAEEVFAAMETVDLQVYIQSYVWNSEPRGTSLFFDTQRTAYGARVL